MESLPPPRRPASLESPLFHGSRRSGKATANNIKSSNYLNFSLFLQKRGGKRIHFHLGPLGPLVASAAFTSTGSIYSLIPTGAFGITKSSGGLLPFHCQFRISTNTQKIVSWHSTASELEADCHTTTSLLTLGCHFTVSYTASQVTVNCYSTASSLPFHC